MAQLNFNLLNPPGSENIANAFVKGMDQAQAERRSERALQLQDAQIQQSLRQGRMEEMKYEKLRRDEEALNNFYQNAIKNGAPENPKLMAKMMMESGVPEIVKTGIALHTKQLEVEEARRQAELDMYGPGGAPTAAPAAAPVAAPVAAPGDLLGLGNQLMPTNALAASAPAAPVANALVAPSAAPVSGMSKEEIDALRRIRSKDEGVRKAGELAYKQIVESRGAKPTQVNLGNRIALVDDRPGSPTFGQELKSYETGATPGQLLVDQRAKQTAERDEQRLALEARRVGLDQRRVVIAEQQARQAADPNFQRTMATARTAGETAAKDAATAQRVLPTAISTAEQLIDKIDGLIGAPAKIDASGKKVPAIPEHPGFQNAVGTTWLPGARFIDGTDAANFMARFEEIQGGAFLEAFETLKGGGSITEKEGEKATAARNRMKIAQDEREFRAAAREYQDTLRTAVQRAKQRLSNASPAAGTWEVVR